VNTVISLYYYLRVIAPTVLDTAPPELTADGAQGQRATAPLAAVLAITGMATLAFGVAAEPLLALAERATTLGG
jgi:NADH:ubiquinone oxidoreductase subunit 2 (subunit N)